MVSYDIGIRNTLLQKHLAGHPQVMFHRGSIPVNVESILNPISVDRVHILVPKRILPRTAGISQGVVEINFARLRKGDGRIIRPQDILFPFTRQATVAIAN